MSKLNKETIHTLTQLSRIACSEEEQEDLLRDLKKLLDYMKLLEDIDTTHVAPCYQVLEGACNVMRDDRIGTPLARDEFLANVPKKAGGLVSVPPVMKQG